MRLKADPSKAIQESLTAYAIAQQEDYQVAPHHRLIARKLEAVARGEVKRLMIFMPPRHGKSRLASEFFPAWFLGRNPKQQVIACTYAQELANDFGRKVRNQLQDPLFQAIFPESGLREDSKSASRFHTSEGGVYFAVGAGGPITGRGAHVLLIDDPIKNSEEADSETHRRKLKDWYASVAYTRLMPGGAVVVIQTRWHEDDLAGWLLREHAHEGWEVLSLPAISEEDQPLWPEAFPLERLQAIKRAVGSRVWEALYQQRPSPAEGGLIKRGWWKYYREAPSVFDEIIQSWDATFKDTQKSDFVVGQVWGRVGGDKYLLDQVRGRMDFPTTVQAIRMLSAKWPQAHAKLVEDKANGPALIAVLGSEIPGLIPVQPMGSKEARVSAVTPTIEAGNVYLPDPSLAEWVGDFVEECSAFPSAAHDDQVDAMSQALLRFAAGFSSDGEIYEYDDPIIISPY